MIYPQVSTCGYIILNMNLHELSKIADVDSKKLASKVKKLTKKTVNSKLLKSAVESAWSGFAPALGVAAVPVESVIKKLHEKLVDLTEWEKKGQIPKVEEDSDAYAKALKWANKARAAGKYTPYSSKVQDAEFQEQDAAVQQVFKDFHDFLLNEKESSSIQAAFVKLLPTKLRALYADYCNALIEADAQYEQEGPKRENYGDDETEKERYFEDIVLYADEEGVDPEDLIDDDLKEEFKEWSDKVMTENEESEEISEEPSEKDGEDIDIKPSAVNLTKLWNTGADPFSKQFANELKKQYPEIAPKIRGYQNDVKDLISQKEEFGKGRISVDGVKVTLDNDECNIYAGGRMDTVWNSNDVKYDSNAISMMVLRNLVEIGKKNAK